MSDEKINVKKWIEDKTCRKEANDYGQGITLLFLAGL